MAIELLVKLVSSPMGCTVSPDPLESGSRTSSKYTSNLNIMKVSKVVISWQYHCENKALNFSTNLIVVVVVVVE